MEGTTSPDRSTITLDRADQGLTRALLACGVVAGPLYIALAVIQVAINPGFDVRHNALSQMVLGDLGWIQITNFIASGLLALATAIGLRRAIRSGRGRTWAPILVGVFGAGIIAAAFFPADPGFGFPPGAPAGPPAGLSSHGMLHFAAAGVAFYALIGACVLFFRRFRSLGQPAWARYSLATGLFFLVAFVGTASGSGGVAFNLALWMAIFAGWVWLALVAHQLRSDLSRREA